MYNEVLLITNDILGPFKIETVANLYDIFDQTVAYAATTEGWVEVGVGLID